MMLIRNSTLPADTRILQRFQDANPTPFPILPLSPEPGSADAGWLIGPEGDASGYAWLRRQTGKRGLLDLRAPADARESCRQVILECAAAWELERLVSHIPEDDEAARRDLEALGFSPFGRILPMTGTVPDAAPLPEAGPDLFLRAYSDLGHLPTLAALLHRAYHDLPGRPEYETDGVTVETVRDEMDAAGSDIRPDHFLALNDFGKGVGVVRCRTGGWIDGPGIVPEARAGDLHRILLAAALHRLSNTGVANARLVVYEPVEDWVHDYQVAGFTPGTPRIVYQKELE